MRCCLYEPNACSSSSCLRRTCTTPWWRREGIAESFSMWFARWDSCAWADPDTWDQWQHCKQSSLHTSVYARGTSPPRLAPCLPRMPAPTKEKLNDCFGWECARARNDSAFPMCGNMEHSVFISKGTREKMSRKSHLPFCPWLFCMLCPKMQRNWASWAMHVMGQYAWPQ